MATLNTEPVDSQLLSTRIHSPDPNTSVEKIIRRKASFIKHLDSSEELPSSHASLFDAEYLSNSEDSGLKRGHVKAAVVDVRHPLPLCDIVNLPSPPNIFGESAVVYGYGTALSIISEQNSKSDMRSASRSTNHHSIPRPHSAPDLALAISSSHPHLLNKDDAVASMMAHIPPGHRRAMSLSAEAIQLSTLRSYHAIISSINRDSTSNDQTRSFARPLSPVASPMRRSATPPGMPSWTAAQQPRRPTPNADARLLPRFQRLLSFGDRRLSSCERRAAAFYASLSPGISGPASNEGPAYAQTISRRDGAGTNGTSVRSAPRFRPVRSGHGTNTLEMHPFARALDGTSLYEAASNPESKPDLLLQPARMERIANPSSSLQGRRIFTEVPRLVSKDKQSARSLPIQPEPQTGEFGPKIPKRASSIMGATCPHGRVADQQPSNSGLATSNEITSVPSPCSASALPGPHDGSQNALHPSSRKLTAAKHRPTHSALVPLLTPNASKDPSVTPNHVSARGATGAAQTQTLCLPHDASCITPSASPFASGGLGGAATATPTPVSSLRLQETPTFPPSPLAILSPSPERRESVNAQRRVITGSVSNGAGNEHNADDRVLMARAPASARAHDCWRCRCAELADELIDAVIEQWRRCVEVCCFVCCGYDDDDDDDAVEKSSGGRRGRQAQW